ncbi:MAG: hypothetical protein K5656_05550, partial [Lachnospiraceae bacterium]|nr:hypothetical protein [Lachnospiraceae bacterium]
MEKMELITPNCDIVDIFNSFWTDEPKTTLVKLFKDDVEVDISKYITQFKEYGSKDDDIIGQQGLLEYLNAINSVYHTRVSGIESIVKELESQGIDSKLRLEETIKNGEMSLPTFVKYCQKVTGKYTYSFASKVFSFVDEKNYPIIDSFVATLLDTYEYEGKISKSKWGNYSQYINNYNAFRNHFGLTKKTYKDIDKFLWTYAKILSDYWSDLGVLSYEAVP